MSNNNTHEPHVFELIATSAFGLEAVLRREIEAFGLEILRSQDGRIYFSGDARAIIKANLWLRSADRVYILLGEKKVTDFDGLFNLVASIPWDKYMDVDAGYIVEAISVKSQLHSLPSIQSISEKAIIKVLSKANGLSADARLSKKGARHRIRINIQKDICAIMLDTSGDGLHKRGYRNRSVAAPIKETLAAGLILLSFFKDGRTLIDPFCGSGTIPIEAAMIARGIAPGLGRKFDSEKFRFMDAEMFKEERASAFKAINHDVEVKIYAFDADKAAIEATREHAINAGVDDLIIARRKKIEVFDPSTFEIAEDAIVITNPPYGERIGEENELRSLGYAIKKLYQANPAWSWFVITADDGFEKAVIGKPATRRRKLYNGRIKTTYYQYLGERTKK
ncbi:MAG: class I SAM-dependent RNA methyltransferase [Clostridiales Family XIII bacterium]|jgi:putative N6-adenine-specific DNA methylase|nr:class I SAM-dependent RNA methyltransferase [Clostridiales Family XIII bacterium]